MTKATSSTAIASVDPEGPSAAQRIDAKIAGLDDWRGTTLARVRHIIQQADPGVVETVKWRGVPVWEHDGILCTGETYARAVKMTFAKGAALADPAGLFNASLTGNTRRAIDLHEGDTINATALTALIRAAVALNVAATAAKTPSARKRAATRTPADTRAAAPTSRSHTPTR